MTRIRYAHADDPGISRKKLSRGWAYFDSGGARIICRDEIDRLNAIALPPAYRDAWFSPSPDAHILATGVDARGRKQYRYHPLFRRRRETEKYRACARFGAKLPAIRKRVARDLAARKPTATRAVAAIVRLLDTGQVRIGNEGYARANGSFGVSTLLARHAAVDGRRLTLRYRAKGGRPCEVALSDAALARFVRQMQDLPGQRLFQYVDDDGAVRTVGSSDVNDYIRETMGESFTAKDFRTWAASALAYEALAGPDDLSLAALTGLVADRLGNTPAIARKSYIHPRLVEIALNGRAGWRARLKPLRASRWLSSAERGLIRELERRRA